MHTFKRDYVQLGPLPDARAVPELIGGRIENQNENRPHSALEWRAPAWPAT